MIERSCDTQNRGHMDKASVIHTPEDARASDNKVFILKGLSLIKYHLSNEPIPKPL
jgi:hypothetical protein